MGSNFHEIQNFRTVSQLFDPVDLMNYPERVTLGFRGVFNKVFSNAYRVGCDSQDIDFLSIVWTVKSAYIFVVDQGAFPIQDGRQTKYLCVFELETDGLPEDESPNDRASQFGLNEQQFIAELFSNMARHTAFDWVTNLKHDRNWFARFAAQEFTAEEDSGFDPIALTAFYCFGLLLTWQVQRELANIDISFGGKKYAAIIKSTLEIRKTILNVERWILTRNVSNDRDIRQYCGSLKSSLGLEEKYARLLPLNESIERITTSAANANQERHAKKLTVSASVLAILGIPIAFLTLLLTFSPSSTILEDGPALLVQDPVASFFVIYGIPVIIITALIAIIIWLLMDRQ
jgi:hypothetical protein